MLIPFLRRTFSVENALSNGIWGLVYGFIYAGVAALVPVALHAATSLTWPWLLVVGFSVFCLLAAGTLAVWARSREIGASSSGGSAVGYSPAERREHMDNLFYPPGDDRRELGEECATFAMKMQVFNEDQEWRRERATAQAAQEIRAADPSIDPLKARRDAESYFEQTVRTLYVAARREQALRLFDEAREKKAIAAKTRRLVENPLAVEMGEIPHLFWAIARRLTEKEVSERLSDSSPPPLDLAEQIDTFMREGIDLVAEFSESVEPEKTDDGWKLEGGDAPDEWWDKADDFAKRIRKLLLDRRPALLTDYRDGYTGHVKKEREADKESEPDTRSTAKKMLDLANYECSGPRRVVEASLEGLAAASHRITGNSAS